MKLIGNILWVIFVGWELALGFLISGLIACGTIIFIPVGIQFFKLARLAILPFGTEVNYNFNPVRTTLNIVWAILFGWIYALVLGLFGVVLCCTIIFIPFGLQVFKFAKLVFMPLGTTVG